jgi:hypothetical protein
MSKTMMVVAAFGLAVGLPLGAAANDEPDSLVPCKSITARPGNLTTGVGARLRLECEGGPDLPDEPDNDPLIEGGTLRVFDMGGAAGDDTYDLPAANWKRIPSDPMNALRGFRYRATPTPTLPCKLVLVRENKIKAACRNQAMTLTPPFNGDAAIVLTIGTNSKRYCGQLGGTLVFNSPRHFWRRNAPAPSGCSSPSGAFLEIGAGILD